MVVARNLEHQFTILGITGAFIGFLMKCDVDTKASNKIQKKMQARPKTTGLTIKTDKVRNGKGHRSPLISYLSFDLDESTRIPIIFPGVSEQTQAEDEAKLMSILLPSETNAN
jgi:hypothetical protein